MIDLVAQDKDIIVMRTFSKIYGMAGLRAGFAVGRPDLLAKFGTVGGPSRSLASISITSSAGARASLQDKDLVPLRKKINCGHTFGDAGVFDEEGLQDRSWLAGQHVHGGCEASGQGVPAGDVEGECCGWTYVGGDAELCSRNCRNQVGDGEVPDCFREVHGYGAGNGEWSASLHMPEFHVPSELYRGLIMA